MTEEQYVQLRRIGIEYRDLCERIERISRSINTMESGGATGVDSLFGLMCSEIFDKDQNRRICEFVLPLFKSLNDEFIARRDAIRIPSFSPSTVNESEAA